MGKTILFITVALLALSACSGHAPPKWSLAQSRCEVSRNMVFSGDLETLFGRMRSAVRTLYPALKEKPLLRSLHTDWYPVDHESEYKTAEYAERTTYSMRFAVKLKGEGPYRVLLQSETRAHVQRTWLRADAVVERRTVPGKTLRRFEDQLREHIREQMDEFASNCTGGMLKSRCGQGPLGQPEQYRAPKELPENTLIQEPLACPRSSAYIRVERSQGKRRLGTGRKHGTSGGFTEGCRDLSDIKGDDDCQVINAITILHEAGRRLRRQGITLMGTGLGPCGKSDGDYEAWNMAVAVQDWKYAAQAVITLAQVMAQYDLSGFAGVAVVGMECATLLGSSR